ncbi:DUF6694 family lipoprotein [Pseudomonas serbica]|uniref:DUF6694 family lipoprotein n=1 Tax=Pseudomonas serbica TaxID=2965074 RepID=UPI00237A9E35|nr:DUF6694 family lipoprotein [Pseudomonas serbica]
MFKKALLPMLIVAALSGCYDKKTTTVDGSSQVTLTDSLGKITGSLPGDQQMQYVQDVTLLKNTYQLDQLQIDLNGKNAQEIMATAQQLRDKLMLDEQQKIQAQLQEVAEQSKQRDLASLRADIDTLKAKRDAELTKLQFKIDSVVFEHSKNSVTDVNDPVINLLVTNNTKLNVFGASLEGVLTVADQAEPLHTGLLDLQLEKILLPGESISTSIKPSIISDWRSVKAPENAALALTVKDLRDEKGESLVGGLSFTKEDGDQLTAMAQQLLALDPTAQTEAEALINPAQIALPLPVTAPEASSDAEPAPVAPTAPEAAQPDVSNAMPVQLMPESEVSLPKEAEVAQAQAPEVAAPVTAEPVVEAPEATPADENAPDFTQIQAPTEAPAAENTPASN